jgi:hypothetical protein
MHERGRVGARLSSRHASVDGSAVDMEPDTITSARSTALYMETNSITLDSSTHLYIKPNSITWVCSTCLSDSSSFILTRLSGPRSRLIATQKIWQRRESNSGPLVLEPGSLTKRPQRRSQFKAYLNIYNRPGSKMNIDTGIH